MAAGRLRPRLRLALERWLRPRTVAYAHDVTPVWNQSGFLWRNDNGTLVTATGLASQNANPSTAALSLDTNYRIRFEIEETATASPAGSLTPIFEYRVNTGGGFGAWTRVNATSSFVRSATSANVADNAATANLITTSVRTFQAGAFDEVDGALAAIAGLSNENTEVEFCFQLRSPDFTVAGTVVELRVTNNAVALNTYSQTPSYQVSVAATTLTPSPVVASAAIPTPTLVLPVTRMHFPSSGTAEISPSPDAAWDVTSGLTRLPTQTGTGATGVVTLSNDTTSGAGVDADHLILQAVSQGMAAGSIASGATIELQFRIREANVDSNQFMVVCIRIVSNDGATTRGYLVPLTRDDTEMSAVTETNRRFTATVPTGFSWQNGDRLLVEVGTGGTPAGAGTHDASLQVRDNTSDLAEDDSQTTAGNPWLEIGAVLTGWGTAPDAGTTLTPSPVAATATVPTATVTLGAITRTPDPVVATASVPTPTVARTLTLSPSPSTASAAVPAPTLAFGALTLTPSPVAASAAVPAPSIARALTLSPSPASATAAVPAPAVALVLALAPSPVTATGAVPVPSVTLGALTIAPDPASAAALVPAPTVSVQGGPLTLSPDPVVASAAVPTPSVSLGALTLSPTPAAATGAVPQPTVALGTLTLAPDPVSATAAVPAPSISVGGAPATTLTPSPVVATAAVPAATVTLGTLVIAPSPVVGSAAVPAPAIALALVLTPAPVAAVAAVPAPALIFGAIVLVPSPVISQAAVPAVAIAIVLVTATPVLVDARYAPLVAAVARAAALAALEARYVPEATLAAAQQVEANQDAAHAPLAAVEARR